MATRQTAADKNEHAKVEQARAEAKSEHEQDHEAETVEVSDPNNNDRPFETSTGIAEPTRPAQPVAVDAQGVARAMPRLDSGWEPAPLEASDEDKARAKERNEREEELLEAQREGRVHPVTGEILSKAEAKKAKDESKAEAKS